MDGKSILTISSIAISVIAALICIIVYIRTYLDSSKDISRVFLGILNLIISLAMLSIVAAALLFPTASDAWLATVTFIGVICIVAFIVGQAIFLASSRSPLRERQKPSDDRDALLEETFRSRLLDDSRVKTIQILGMYFPLAVTDMYIPRKVYDGISLSTRIDTSEESDLLDLLNRQYEEFEQLVETAQAPLPLLYHQSRRHAVVLGDPGIGKTALLKYLALQTAGRKIPELSHLLPIFVSLNDYIAERAKHLDEFIIDRFSRQYELDKRIVKDFINRKLNDGTLLLLLDGLDETYIGENATEARKSYKNVRNEIASIAETYSDIHIVVTSRKAVYLDDPIQVHSASFKELEMIGFQREDVRDFVVRWFQARPIKEANSELSINPEPFILKLQQQSRLRELAVNPLFLAIITNMYHEGLRKGNTEPDIPINRASLYKKYVDSLFQGWDSSKGFARAADFKVAEKKAVLKELAWKMHNGMVSSLGKKDTEEIIQAFLKERGKREGKYAELLLNEIMAQGLLIGQDGEETEAFSFSHLTFQEYFVAEAIVDADSREKHNRAAGDLPGDRLLKRYGDPWWDGVIFLYAAYTKREDFISRIMAALAQNDDIFNTRLLLAGRLLAAKPTSIGLQVNGKGNLENVRNKLLEDLRTTSYSPMADTIAEVLVDLADAAINQELLNMLTEKESGNVARMSIVKTLSKWGDDRVPIDKFREEWLPRLNDSRVQEIIRRYVIYALGAWGDHKAIPDLIGYLAQTSVNEMSDLRLLMIDAIRRSRDLEAIPGLCKLLGSQKLGTREEQVQERVRVIQALGVLGRSDVARENNVGERQEQVEKTLLGILRDDQSELDLRLACIDALSKWQSESTISRLREMACEDTLAWRLRKRMYIVLYVLDPPARSNLRTELISAFEDEKIASPFRIEFAQVLVAQKVRELAPELVDLIGKVNIDSPVRIELAKAVGKLGDHTAAERLLQTSKELQGDDFVHFAVIRSLGELYDAGKLQSNDLIRHLLELLSNPSPLIMIACAEVLGQVNIKDSLDRAKEKLREYRKINPSSDEIVLRELIITSGILGEEDELEDLVKLLFRKQREDRRDPFTPEEVRSRIVMALKKTATSDTVQQLLAGLRNASADVCFAVAEVLEDCIEKEDDCKRLYQVMEQLNGVQKREKEAKDRIYCAVWKISLKKRFRVYKEGEIKIAAWPSAEDIMQGRENTRV
jgi:HEAT repeat protein